MGEIIGSFKLLTLETLIDEFLKSKRLQDLYAWAIADVRAENLKKISLQLTAKEKANVKEELDLHEQYVQEVIEKYCVERNIAVRSLSRRDLELLSTTIAINAIVATDEWPLRLVVKDLISVEGEYQIDTIASLDILHLLESDGKLTGEERRQTVISWIRYDEKLPRGWEADYKQLFGESPPTL
jgi:hypothetical protein